MTAKMQAYDAACVAIAKAKNLDYYPQYMWFTFVPRTLRTIAQLRNAEARARQAVELYPHDLGARMMYMDGWKVEQIAAEFHIHPAEECTCNGLTDACRVCAGRADPEAELPY